MQRDAVRLEPARRAGLEAEGDDHRIGRNDLLGIGHDLGQAAAARPGRSEPRLTTLTPST